MKCTYENTDRPHIYLYKENYDHFRISSDINERTSLEKSKNLI